MEISKAIQEFLEIRELENCSAKTLRTYEQRLRYFSEWLQSECGIVEVEAIRLEHLRGWMAHLKKTLTYRGEARSDDTIYSYGQSLVVFCHWLEREERVTHSITKHFKLPRVEEKFIPTFTPDDIEKLLKACEDNGAYNPEIRKALIARDKAIVTLLVDSGIRLSELAGLRLGDIDKAERVLLVHGKGNRWQQVPVSRDGFKPLHTYLSRYRAVLAGGDRGEYKPAKDDAAFLADDGKPLTIWGVSMLFKRLKKKTGIDDKRVSAHNCRRYMATTEIANGRNQFDVQRQMRHRSIKMTNHYASLSIQQLQRSHEKYSPLKSGDSRPSGPYGTGYWEE
jgi:site-specific recombinase XerD